MTDAENVVQFDQVRREAERLANMGEVDRSWQLPKRAKEIGVPEARLKSVVNAIQRERSEAVAADNLAKDRERRQAEQRHAAEKRELDRQRKEEQSVKREQEKIKRQADKQAEQEKLRAEKKAEEEKAREAKAKAKEAERKAKVKAKAFGNLAKLPTARRDDGLTKLADQLGTELAALRAEFQKFVGVDGGDAASAEKTEAWPKPVNTAKLLSELGAKISKYVVLQDHQLTAAILWTAHAWTYDYDVPIHSPILAATSAEPDSGKSTLVAVLGRASPRFSLNVEMTGPSLYRFVDAVKPTLVIDEADDLFARKSDLKSIINAGWTRGARIPRQVSVDGVWRPVSFDPYTPKMIALIGRSLPPATRSRCVELRMFPKRTDEHVEIFNQLDDEEFATLRRKFARWAKDNAPKLKDMKPTLPAAMTNRAAQNWSLLLAIAELAGGPWPNRVRAAAERLTHRARRPSDGVQLLAAFKAVFADRKTITSEQMVEYLRADPTSVWSDYNHGGPITQRQIAHLLDAYDIRPVATHPTGKRDLQRRGYRIVQFVDAFERYTAGDPISRSPKQRPPKQIIKKTRDREIGSRAVKSRRASA
jgi:putative DNA primase/helicase